MSTMAQARRRIAKSHSEREKIVGAAFKPEEYFKHRSHQKALVRAVNREAAEGRRSGNSIAEG